jgi:hypothetical protein
MSTPAPSLETDLVHTHLRFGWGMLLVFVCLGAALEAMHGFKVPWYLDVGQETRRLMWRLAHAHGTLLSVLNLGFAFTLSQIPGWTKASAASKSLRAASVLLPGGFFAGGVVIYDGDPGLGIALVPLGAAALLFAIILVVLGLRRPS